MKEYIEKDKVKTILARIQESQLDALPTITKADIINEFTEWLRLQSQPVALDRRDSSLILVVRDDRWVDAKEIYLAEMEEEE